MSSNDRLPLLFLLLLLLLLQGTALALPEDRKAPLEVEADRAEIDQAAERTTFTGRVQVVQGSFTLWADKVVVQYRDRKPREIVATGNPARFRQLPEKDKAWVRGSGRRIVYRFDSDDIVLTGDAELLQEKDSFRSDRIVYDRRAGRLKAGAAAGGRERVKVIIHPEETGQ